MSAGSASKEFLKMQINADYAEDMYVHPAPTLNGGDGICVSHVMITIPRNIEMQHKSGVTDKTSESI